MGDDFFPDSFRQELSDTEVELNRIQDLADGVARSISTGFRAALLDGKSLQSVLGDIARSFADIALKAAIKPLGDLVGLAERFSSGRVSARDLTAILGAGLRGGGTDLSDDDLARLAIEGGLKGAADIAARLLRATFGEAA